MPKYKTKNFTDADINNIINLYELGYSIQEIRDVTGIAKNVIKKYIVMKYDGKIPITSDEIAYFRKCFKSGKSLVDISSLTGRTASVIRTYIKDLISSKKEQEEEEKLRLVLKQKAEKNSRDILDIYLNSVYEMTDIAEYYEMPIDPIRDIIKSWVDKCMPYNRLFELPLDTTKIKIFKDFYCSPGDKYKIDILSPLGEYKSNTITIEKLYPKIIDTNKGSFTYKDIILKAKLVSRTIKNN
jgi:predicted DNA-binding protein YlxM (UPF0122 family)